MGSGLSGPVVDSRSPTAARLLRHFAAVRVGEPACGEGVGSGMRAVVQTPRPCTQVGAAGDSRHQISPPMRT